MEDDLTDRVTADRARFTGAAVHARRLLDRIPQVRQLLLVYLLAASAFGQTGKFGTFTNSDDVGDPPIKGAAEFDADLKIMFITGFAAVALHPSSQAPKQAKVLSKPFHLREIVQEVERMIAA